jgi:ubiquinone/menaquinone biosynthesis C-methylase UbiE
MCDLSIVVVLLVGLTGLVFAWCAVARRNVLPCPPAFIWLLQNRAMEKVAGSALLLDRAGVIPGMNVLGAGCGPGRLTVPLAERVGEGGSVLAVDSQEKMLSRLRARLEAGHITNVHTLHATLGGGELPASTIDRALLVTVLSEIPDGVGALGEIRRSLRPGGILSVTEVFPDPHCQPRNTVRRLAGQAGLQVRGSFGNRRAFTANLVPAEDQTAAGSVD